jgi:aminoglycoside phosphotransferase family enzyme/predicted kinase
MSSETSTLIAAMQQADFYPHPVASSIELVQTHVSNVFLTGEYAYKVKKAVNFGFLDFSTLEKRQHFLAEEIRLNQPLAESIYLEVLPIAKQDDRYVLGGTGEVVEYALKMRQFPQEDLLSELFEVGKLQETDLEELGKIVAQFHSQTVTSDYIKAFGEIDRIRQSIDENYQQTSKYIGIAQTQAQYEATKDFTDNFFVSREALFQQRRDENKIRECHGDLHLRNICKWQDKIQLFDRIEFNEPFRFVDVMYDVAFAVMDLEARGRKDLGNAFLNAYAEQTGDWEGLQVLPLYLSRQAYVRAKVTSFLLDDAAIPAPEKESARKIAAAYYKQAYEYTQPQQIELTLMSGLSGSGKSTLAKRLAREQNAVQIRSDAVRKHLAGIPLQQKGDPNLYTPAMSQKTYSRMLELARLLLVQGFSVILDARYDLVTSRTEAIDLARSLNIPVKIAYCNPSIEVIKSRLAQRSNDISDATVDLLSQQQETTEAFTASELVYVTEYNS